MTFLFFLCTEDYFEARVNLQGFLKINLSILSVCLGFILAGVSSTTVITTLIAAALAISACRLLIS